MQMLSVVDPRFILMVLLGSVAGLFVGAIPGLSVSMATALLVSITYTWEHSDALAMIMGVYVVGVFSGAVSAILINIPGAPSSVVTTLDGYPMSKKGQSYKALFTATIYSFIGSLFGLLALGLLAEPVSRVAIKFTKMDYFLLALFGLATVGSVSTKNYAKGLISVMIGLVISMIGLDPLMGTKRLTFGIQNLAGGVSTVPALVGFFGFAEVLSVVYNMKQEQNVLAMEKAKVSLKEILKSWKLSLYTSTIGLLVGALPGAGGPVASFIAYNEAKRLVKKPEVPFGEGAVEGIVASESSNNACIGGALIPMLTLAVPGDAVTAIILSVFYVHGLQPGPLFITQNKESFYSIVVAGIIACFALLLLGLIVAPRICKVITIPKNIMIPVVTSLCVIGSFACNNRLFDVGLMFFFGLMGFMMRRFDYPVAQFIHVHITYMLCIIPIKRSAVFHVKSIHQVLCRRISSLRAFIAHRFIACFKSACLGSVAAFENQLGRIEQIVIPHIQRIAAYFGQVIFIHCNHSSRGFRCLLPFCRLSAWVMERTGCIKQRSGLQSKYGSLRRTTGITPVISMIYRQSIIRNNPVALRNDKVNHRIKRRRFHQIDFFRFISPEQQRNVPITLGKFKDVESPQETYLIRK